MKRIIRNRCAWESENPAYPTWKAMMRRCGQKGNPTPREKRDYADCGIRVCDDWTDYATFVDWLVENKWTPGRRLNVARLDKTAGYSPENCVVIPQGTAQQLKRNIIREESERRRRNRAAIRRWYEEHPLYPTWHDLQVACGILPGQTDRQRRTYAGVSVCAAWRSDYLVFEDWALKHGWRRGRQVVRRDKAGPYCPENCFISDWETNVNLRRNTARLDGISLRSLFGKGTEGRGDRTYRRFRDRIVRCGWDLGSARHPGFVRRDESARISTRVRSERSTGTSDTKVGSCAGFDRSTEDRNPSTDAGARDSAKQGDTPCRYY